MQFHACQYAMKAGREAFLLVAGCALLYLTGAGAIPFYTRGEPREGLVVREMIRTGAWLVPARPEGEPARKPPLYYWLAAAALRTVPERPELALRLPSATFASAAVLGTWATARAVWGSRAGLPAALVLATAFEWTRAATSARVDMTLAAALTAVLGSWTLALAGRGRWWAALAAAGMVLGTLAKGPVALVLPALAAAALAATRGDLRPLRPLAALAAAAAVAAAWYAVAFLREGGAFLEVVLRENWFRFVDAERGTTGHAHHLLYLLPVGLVGLLPWTPIIPLALVPLRAAPRAPAAALAAAWVVTGLVFFALAAAKRSVYLLPLYPALALLVGAGIAAGPIGGRLGRVIRLGAALYAPAALLLVALAGALAVGIDAGGLLRDTLRPADAAGAVALIETARSVRAVLVILAGATLAAVPLLLGAVRRESWRRLVVVVAALFVAWTASFDALLHPAIARTRSLRGFFALVSRELPAEAPLYALFPPDPGLRFYAPRTLAPWPPRGAARGGYLLLWEDEWRRLRDAAGRPLGVLAVSEANQPGRGHLALVVAPAGPLVPARDGDPAVPAGPPGFRMGSRPR